MCEARKTESQTVDFTRIDNHLNFTVLTERGEEREREREIERERENKEESQRTRDLKPEPQEPWTGVDVGVACCTSTSIGYRRLMARQLLMQRVTVTNSKEFKEAHLIQPFFQTKHPHRGAEHHRLAPGASLSVRCT